MTRPFAERRQQLGLSLHQAAARLGIHHRYLRSLELGRLPLSPTLAARMASEYEATVGELTRPAAAGGHGRGRRRGETSPPSLGDGRTL
jgi:transcriptional regulator with XRE-family HTH domain